ncbi:MAG: protein kinase [Clostridia bacterium]|nr:protein kinase [Clostridia bacterium]
MNQQANAGAAYQDKEDFYRQLNASYDQIQVINTTGGGGIIYSGIHRRLKQKVVLKKIRSNVLNEVDSELEKNALMGLKHTYLPQILDFWSYGDEVYTVMEFIEGNSLKELLDNGRRFTQREVIRMTRQLAEVLHYLHTSKLHIIHSDVKPANIMLTPEGNICLIDFNISVLQDGEIDETVGYSVGYSPVEQIIRVEEHRRMKRERRDQAAVHTPAAQPLSDDDRTRIEFDEDTTSIEFDDDATTIGDDDRTTIGEDSDATSIEDDTTSIDGDMTDLPTGTMGTISQTLTPPPQKRARGKKKIDPNDKMAMFQAELDKMKRKYGTKQKVDERSDIYSACATMYHLLTGQRPDICFHKLKPITALVPSVDEVFAQILTRGLEQDPRKRYKSSAQFQKALAAMTKGNKRYKRLRFAQDLTLSLVIMLLAGSTVSAWAGLKRTMEIRAEEAVAEASALYAGGSYDEALEYLDENVYAFPFKPADTVLSDAYYIGGNCWLSREDYDHAVEYFMQAIVLDSSRPIYYRDYGIALVRRGELDRASECLLQAQAKGLSTDSLLLLQGEINAASGNVEEAMDELAECIEISDDDMVSIRAAMKLDELVRDNSIEDYQTYDTRISILSPLAEEIESADCLPLLSRLAQVYIDYHEFSGDTKYMTYAVDVLNRIIGEGYGTLTEWLNKAVCLQSLKHYDSARDCLLEAAGKYPGSYLIYKRLAFLEIERQYELDADSRDYSDFKNYYDTCMSLFQSGGNTVQDMEIDYLERVYDEVVDKGWLTE